MPFTRLISGRKILNIQRICKIIQELRDSVRECLEKEPSQRGAEDLAVLIEFMASLPALASLPMGIKRQLCEKMVFAVVPHKGTTIMQHGERIDAW